VEYVLGFVIVTLISWVTLLVVISIEPVNFYPEVVDLRVKFWTDSWAVV